MVNGKWLGFGSPSQGGKRKAGAGLPFTTTPFTIHRLSVESESVHAVPLRGVGEDDGVAHVQPLDDLDVVDGGAAEFDLRARGLAPVGADLEERDGRLTAAARRGAADVEYVVQPLKFDGAVHAQVDARALRHRAFEPH